MASIGRRIRLPCRWQWDDKIVVVRVGPLAVPPAGGGRGAERVGVFAEIDPTGGRTLWPTTKGSALGRSTETSPKGLPGDPTLGGGPFEDEAPRARIPPPAKGRFRGGGPSRTVSPARGDWDLGRGWGPARVCRARGWSPAKIQGPGGSKLPRPEDG